MDGYPPLAEGSDKANNSEPAVLSRCTHARMQSIAKDVYVLSGVSRLTKEPLYHAIYNHMLTIEDCEQCKGNCNPVSHSFLPLLEITSPMHSPNGRSTRQNAVSPQSMVRTADNSNDAPVGESSSMQLYDDQPTIEENNGISPHISPQQPLNLQCRVNMGGSAIRSSQSPAPGGSSTAPGTSGTAPGGPGTTSVADAVAQQVLDDHRRTQAQYDKAERDEDARREKEIQDILAQAQVSSLDDQIASSRAKQKELAERKHAEKEAAHEQRRRDALAEVRRSRTAPRPTVIPPRGPARPAPILSHEEEVSHPAHSSSEIPLDNVFEEVVGPSASAQTRDLVKIFSQSMVLALKAHDKSSSPSIPINSTGVNDINAVPNAPNTGRMALRSVPNKQMADRFGLAPMPNMVVEGDPSKLDYQKVSKYMKSGAKRVAGEFVERQTTWPEKCLAPSAPGYNKSTHAQLTLPELIEGMIAKTLMETPTAA